MHTMAIAASAYIWYTMDVAFIRTKRRDGRTYYSLVECKWQGKPVQRVIVYLPADSLNGIELSGTFGEQVQRFVDEYTQAIVRLTDEIDASKRSVSERVSRADVRFHRARIERLATKVKALKRCVAVLEKAEAQSKAESGH
jgi:hypothetical protein